MARNSGRTTSASSAAFWKRPDFCTTRAARGTGPRTAIRPMPPACASVTSDNFVVVDITGEAEGDRRGLVPHGADHAARESHLSARSAPVSRGALRLRRAQGLREARGVRLLHRRHRLHAGEGAAKSSKSGSARRRAPRARRRARQPADRGLQEDQVLHHRERGGGQALDAGAGDAHHGLLAAFPGRVSGAVRRLHADGKTERHRAGWATRCAPWRRCC